MKYNKNPAAPGSTDTMQRLSALLQAHAEDLFARILAAESAAFLARYAHLRDASGRDAVVRNGFQPVRRIRTGIGPVSVRAPKLRCRAKVGAVFHSSIVPRYLRSTRTADGESVWRYLYGVTACDLNQVLAALLGTQAAHAAGLVPGVVRRAWVDDCTRKRSGSLAASGTVELWAASVAGDARGDGSAASILVVMGADEGGATRLIALDHGTGDALSRWTSVVCGLLERGLRMPERIQCGPGATGFARALALVREGGVGTRPRPASADEENRDACASGLMFSQRPVTA